MNSHKELWLLILLLFVRCSKDELVVTGTLSHAPASKIYLTRYQGGQFIPLDSAVLGENGSYKFVKPAGEVKIWQLNAGALSAEFLAGTGNVQLDADLSDTTGGFLIKSNSEDQKLNEFRSLKLNATHSAEQVSRKLNLAKSHADSLAAYEESERLSERFYDQAKTYTEMHVNDFAALYTVRYLSSDSDYPLFENVARHAAARYPGNSTADSLVQLVKREADGAVGKQAKPITLADAEGRFHSLGELAGHVVLIDFWASWCAPCRKESPVTVELNKTYAFRGLSILGVSLDRNKNEWLQAIYKDELNWLQVSELKAWQSRCVSDYHIESIPYNVIIDGSGRILAKNLHGTKLKRFFARLYSNIN